MKSSVLHDFHFIMDRSMKKKLDDIDVFGKKGSFSGKIVRMLSLITPVIVKEHKWGKERDSRYMRVCDDPDELREHVHVYLPGDLYRRLKLMHQDLNVFSIAQLVRDFLSLFLVLVKKYGNRVIQILEREFYRWEEEVKATGTRKMRQLWKIIRHFKAKTEFINIYNRQFSPSWILRL